MSGNLVAFTEGEQLYANVSRLVEWSHLRSGAEGERLEVTLYGDRSIQVSGTFGSGGALEVQGSNNGSTWAVLTDPEGDPLRFSAEKIETIRDDVYWIKPVVAGGDGSTDLRVNLLIRRGL